MSMAVFILKAIKVAACLVVMIFFSVIIMLSLKKEALIAERVMGVISLAVTVVFGYVIVRIVRSPNYLRSRLSVSELEEMGMVVTTDYTAARAIQVEEFEDEGLYFLLDIGEGKTLCMSGQDLYEYEPGIEDEDGNPSVRRFPNSHFQLKHHREHGYLLDVVLHGVAFEPAYIFEHFTSDDFEQDRVLEDGQIATAPTFDEIVSNKGRLPYPPTLYTAA